MEQPQPGWYNAPHANNELRYWDGNQWVEPTSPPSPADQTGTYPAYSVPIPGDYATPVGASPARKSKKGWIIAGSIIGGLILVGALSNAINGAGSSNDRTPAAVEETAPGGDGTPAEKQEVAEPEPAVMVTVPEVVGMTASDAFNALIDLGLQPPSITSFEDPAALVIQTEPAAGTEVEEGSDITLVVEEKPALTLSQENAISEAESYLSVLGFSRAGLIQQLEYEGYSPEDATFGADNAGADWNAEAAETAQSYLDSMAFSREGLYQQLAYEEFTPEQIEFALAAVGY